jgi:DUF1365 family protein
LEPITATMAPPKDAITHNHTAFRRKLIISIWTFLTVIWSIFTPPHRTFPARLLLFQPLWALRIWRSDSKYLTDLYLTLATHFVHGWLTGLWRFFRISDFAWLDPNDRVLWLYVEIFGLLAACGGLAGGIVRRGHQLRHSELNGHISKHQSIDEQLLPPLLIPSRTRHTRLFPRKHGFEYSYLFVGVPVGVSGQVSKALSVDSQRGSWFNVKSADYLSRGNEHLGLGDKLKRFLHSQGMTDRDYAFAYLVTAPRFWGYAFNPVSFWYLYDAETVLKGMVLEVNNTFGERRMYLLRPDRDGVENGRQKQKDKTLAFSETWDKDFHVSPFNSRKGSYSLQAIDPLATHEESGHVRIDNTIVLRSSKESPKIVARVWSEGPPYDAVNISNLKLARFIVAWWWVGFITFPRIVWQAQKLFFRRKLYVWYRPEVTETSVGRTYTSDETKLEPYFRAFLEAAVEKIHQPFRLIYQPAHSEGEEVVMYSSGFTYEEDHKQTLTMRVVTPAFYSRFVHYGHTKEAFDREGMATDEKNRTIIVDQPMLLGALFDGIKAASIAGTGRSGNDPRWTLLCWLRCPPPVPSYPEDSAYSVSDIRSFGNAELDIFVRDSRRYPVIYRRTLIKLFLASRFALGLPVLVETFDVLVRIALLVAAMYYGTHPGVLDVLRPRPEPVHVENIGPSLVALALANGVHFWEFLKS